MGVWVWLGAGGAGHFSRHINCSIKTSFKETELLSLSCVRRVTLGVTRLRNVFRPPLACVHHIIAPIFWLYG